MPNDFTMKIPRQIHTIFEEFVKNHRTVYQSGTDMIKDLLKEKAKELLETMEKEKQSNS